MHTKRTIMLIVLAVVLLVAGAAALLVITLGLTGLALCAGLPMLSFGVYRLVLMPWQHHWGATQDERGRPMPGDDLYRATGVTTRAITIEAPPDRVWPWLVQIGHGRGGWYSYDRIDNDGRPSADHIVPELQNLSVGDRIPFMPGQGPVVQEIVPGRHLVAQDSGSSWCLAVHPYGPDGARTRLVSRWRAGWTLTPANAIWLMISDPGSFIMERKMLKGIKARAEAANQRTPV
jgi:hypothetical protein